MMPMPTYSIVSEKNRGKQKFLVYFVNIELLHKKYIMKIGQDFSDLINVLVSAAAD